MSTPKRLIDGVEIANTSTLMYTAPSNTTVVVKSATVCETTDAAITLDLWIVESGGSAADANLLYNDLAVSAKATVDLSSLVNKVLQAGDMIYAQASTASALSLHLSGSEV